MKPPIAPVSHNKHQHQTAPKPIQITKTTQTETDETYQNSINQLQEEVSMLTDKLQEFNTKNCQLDEKKRAAKDKVKQLEQDKLD